MSKEHVDMNTPVIEMRNIVKCFGDFVANDGINLTVHKGEIHAILGENGAGKSTLMNQLYGMFKPTSGDILVNGKKVDIPSYSLQPGDKITLKEKSRKNVQFEANFKGHRSFNLPYFTIDEEGWTGTFARLPERNEIPVEVNDQLVVEFYSK